MIDDRLLKIVAIARHVTAGAMMMNNPLYIRCRSLVNESNTHVWVSTRMGRKVRKNPAYLLHRLSSI